MSEIKPEVPQVDAPPADAPHDLVVDSLTCKRLTVRSDDSKQKLDVILGNAGSGIWLSNADDQAYVGLTLDDAGQAYISFSGPGGFDGGKMPPLVIAVGEDGKPFFQLTSGEQIAFEDLHKAVHVASKLADAFKGAASCDEKPKPEPEPQPAPEPAPAPQVPQPAPGTPDEQLQFGAPPTDVEPQ